MESMVTQSIEYMTRKPEINMHSSELITAVRSQQRPMEIHSLGDIQGLKSLPHSLQVGSESEITNQHKDVNHHEVNTQEVTEFVPVKYR